MPNSRRRKFAVQNEAIVRNKVRAQNESHPLTLVQANREADTTRNVEVVPARTKKLKLSALSKSPNTHRVDPVIIGSSTMSLATTARAHDCACSTTKVNKSLRAHSSDIEVFVAEIKAISSEEKDSMNHAKLSRQRPTRAETNHPTSSRQDRYLVHHRAKVRSPKRSNNAKHKKGSKDTSLQEPIYLNAAVSAMNIMLAQFAEPISVVPDTAITFTNNDVAEAGTPVNNVEVRHSNGSLGGEMCRICHGGDSLTVELGALISACACRGTVGRVHVKCLERWLTESGKSRCELCGTRYTTRRVHKYGFPKALVMWFLSQNAKQLIVDSLGIMLMSPLAIFAAWLSGRTLSGLMTQEQTMAPWPLASTFVLACMTLVCYYCWIVSAATRHALGWWIWYRSQYEVRLQLDTDEYLE